MAGFLSPATREQIRAASDIVDVIGSYLPLKHAGANFVALCPFHKEKTPSFNVNPQKQIFHCFGCHKGGDVFTFVKEYENIGFMDAVRRLAERAKIPLEFENTPGMQESRHLKDQLLDIHEQLTQRWQNCLASEAAGQRARDYLAGRGVSADAIKLFRIGAAPESWDDTVNWARSKNFNLATVEQAGLIIGKPVDAPSAATGGNATSPSAIRYYDRFRGRLIFPICNEQGHVVAFSGRVLAGDEKTAKYVNSPETPIFTKSRIFFGLDKSKRAILDADSAIICEGQLDLIACFMSGTQNIVAPQGTAFTEQHARILKRYANEVVLCFDSDNAGQNAIVRALDHLLAAELAVRVAVVPAPHDPDSFIKANGGAAFQDLIAHAEGFFDYLLKWLCLTHDATTDTGRLAILHGMAEALHKTGNYVLMDTHAQKTALRLGVAVDAVRKEFARLKPRPTAFRAESEPDDFMPADEAEAEAPSRPSLEEFIFIKLLLENDSSVDWLSKTMDSNWLPSQVSRNIFNRRIHLFETASWAGVNEFIDGFDAPLIQSFITECLTRPLITNTDGYKSPRRTDLSNPETQLADVTLKLRNHFLDRQIADLTVKINQGLLNDAEKQVWLNLRTQRRQPLAPLVK
jgi:DNA primase